MVKCALLGMSIERHVWQLPSVHYEVMACSPCLQKLTRSMRGTVVMSISMETSQFLTKLNYKEKYKMCCYLLIALLIYLHHV